jgi:hypothetical protein
VDNPANFAINGLADCVAHPDYIGFILYIADKHPGFREQFGGGLLPLLRTDDMDHFRPLFNQHPANGTGNGFTVGEAENDKRLAGKL